MTQSKEEQVALALSNIFTLAKCIKMEGQFVKENMSLINDKDDLRAFKDLMQKCGFFISRHEGSYIKNFDSRFYVMETKGDSAINELSLRLLENLYEMSANLKPTDKHEK